MVGQRRKQHPARCIGGPISFEGLAMVLVLSSFSACSMIQSVHLRICMILSPAREEVGKRLASPQARVVPRTFDDRTAICLALSGAGGLSQSYASLGRAGEEQYGTWHFQLTYLDMRYFHILSPLHGALLPHFSAFLLFCVG